MASEIAARAAPAQVVYAQVRNSVNAIWNGSAFVTYATANIALYAIALTEQGTASGVYVGTFPVVAAGVYSVEAFVRTGASVAESDASLGSEQVLWSGTARIDAAGLATAWGSRVIGNGRTADMFLQGMTNRVDFAADGSTFTLYSTDDTTPLATGTATRLSSGVGGLRGVDPA